MKKIFLFIVFCVISILAFPQCFQKKNIVIDAGSGLGIYRTHFKDLPNGTLASDTTAAVPYFLSVEYGILNRVGGAFQFGYNHYIQGDSSHGQQANGIDLMLKGNFHFVNTNHVDLLVGLDFGYTHFLIKNNDLNNSQARGGGPIYGGSLMSRFYFGKGSRFGIFINIGYQNRTYPKGGFYNDVSGHFSDFWFRLHGTNFGGGLMFRI